MEGDSLISTIPDDETLFQSTPSAWRETVGNGRALRTLDISIHSLRMEGDRLVIIPFNARFTFQSTPSAWRETVNTIAKIAEWGVFQSTPSAWRETGLNYFL